jgi:hypothetical protein
LFPDPVIAPGFRAFKSVGVKGALFVLERLDE